MLEPLGLVFATVLGYPAAVQVGTAKEPNQGNLRWVVTWTGYKPAGFCPTWNRAAFPFSVPPTSA